MLGENILASQLPLAPAAATQRGVDMDMDMDMSIGDGFCPRADHGHHHQIAVARVDLLPTAGLLVDHRGSRWGLGQAWGLR